MSARVLGLGWCTAQGLGQGRTARDFALGPGPVTVPFRQELFAEPDPRFGRLDAYSKVGLAAAAMALRDAGLDQWRAKRPLAMVAASALGCLDTDAAYMATLLDTRVTTPSGASEHFADLAAAVPAGTLASPQLFAFTLPTIFLGETAIRFGLTGPMYTLAATAPLDLSGVAEALELLADEACPAVLAGACDLALGAPWAAALNPPKAPRGAVFFVLGASRDAGGLTPSAYDACLTFGPNHVIQCNGSPARDMATLVRLCLDARTAPPGHGEAP